MVNHFTMDERILDNKSREQMLHHVVFAAFLFVLIFQAGCGPIREEETWNSYYYGTERQSMGVRYKEEPEDNDDSYVPPKGMWQDDQVPQGQKW